MLSQPVAFQTQWPQTDSQLKALLRYDSDATDSGLPSPAQRTAIFVSIAHGGIEHAALQSGCFLLQEVLSICLFVCLSNYAMRGLIRSDTDCNRWFF